MSVQYDVHLPFKVIEIAQSGHGQRITVHSKADCYVTVIVDRTQGGELQPYVPIGRVPKISIKSPAVQPAVFAENGSWGRNEVLDQQ
jgi:hypothetical protein